MKPKMMILLLLMIAGSAPIFAETVLFPLRLSGVDSANQSSINLLLAEDYGTFSGFAVKVASDSIQCNDKDCALDAGKTMGAEEIVFCSAHRLGSKWIVMGYRYKVADRKLLASCRLDSKSIEDFEFVAKRMAEALAKEKKIEDVATIDNVTASEMSQAQFRRRQGFYSFGFKFGYIFPMGDSSYLKYDYDYTSSPSALRSSRYRQILCTDFINLFELPKDLTLEWDGHVGWGAEIGSHLSLLKIFSRSDFAPYAGGGLGLDFVFPSSYESSDKRNSGFALNGKAGIMMFRTYDFRILADVGYKVVFNDDYDQGVTANLGIVWRKPQPMGGRSSSGSQNPVMGALAVIGGIVVVSILLGAISAAAY